MSLTLTKDEFARYIRTCRNEGNNLHLPPPVTQPGPTGPWGQSGSQPPHHATAGTTGVTATSAISAGTTDTTAVPTAPTTAKQQDLHVCVDNRWQFPPPTFLEEIEFVSNYTSDEELYCDIRRLLRGSEGWTRWFSWKSCTEVDFVKVPNYFNRPTPRRSDSKRSNNIFCMSSSSSPEATPTRSAPQL